MRLPLRTAWTALCRQFAGPPHSADDVVRVTVRLPWSTAAEAPTNACKAAQAEQRGATVHLPKRRGHPAAHAQPAVVASGHTPPTGSHRERVLAMDLEHLKICSATRCQRLRAGGVTTAGDLIVCDPQRVASGFRSPERAERAIRRLRAAVRMAASVERMTPRDAVLLIAIHRRNIRTLACERPAVLHRDLERFSLSSRGSKLVGRRGIPSVRRVKSWVQTCERLTRQRSPADPQLA